MTQRRVCRALERTPRRTTAWKGRTGQNTQPNYQTQGSPTLECMLSRDESVRSVWTHFGRRILCTVHYLAARSGNADDAHGGDCALAFAVGRKKHTTPPCSAQWKR